MELPIEGKRILVMGETCSLSKVLTGGFCIIDDYALKGCKKAVDKFFKNKPGILMPLPTGQAIYYR